MNTVWMVQYRHKGGCVWHFCAFKCETREKARARRRSLQAEYGHMTDYRVVKLAVIGVD